jgi:hypothetical protein
VVKAVVAIAAAALAIAFLFLGGAAKTADSPTARLAGPAQVVFDWSKDACEARDLPDFPARAFRDSHRRVQLIASHFNGRRAVGRDLDHLRHRCKVVMASHMDPDPAKFDDREWIASTYSRNGKRVFALVHSEYHGYEHAGRCRSRKFNPVTPKCWYNAITLASSTNGGRSFRHARAPRHLVASVPYQYVPDVNAFGIFNPTNIVKKDRYYYVLVRVANYKHQKGGVCALRTRKLSDRTSWRAWDGNRFAVRFVNPYRRPVSRPEEHVCRPVAPVQIAKMSHSLTYNSYFKKFLLVGVAGKTVRPKGADGRPVPGGGRTVFGVYYSLSDDTVNWSERQLLMEAEMTWTYRCGDRGPIRYPSLIDPNSRSRNFATTGQRAYLYYTQFNYVSCRPTLDRDLVRVPIAFGK